MTWSHRIIIILLSLIFILSCFCKTSIIIIIWTTTESSIFHVNNNSLINWACWRQAPVIKCLRFFLGGGDFYLFMLWVCHPTLQILTLDRFSDQYLLGKCNGVPFSDFLFTKWTLTNLGRGGGLPGNLWWECVVWLLMSLPLILFQINTYEANEREYSPGHFRCYGDKHLKSWMW